MQPTAVIITVCSYFAMLLLVGWLASRKGGGNATFFTGGRRAPWPVVAFATVGAAISGVTFISVPGMVATKGYAYLQMVLGFIVGYAVIALVLVPVFYKKNLVSIYGYLDERFGRQAYRAGAWMFFVSKMLGASVRFLVVCAVLQALVFEPLGIPFVINVGLTIALIWLYTYRGGVKSVIWTDCLKSFCLIASVLLCIWFIARELGFGVGEMISAVKEHPSAHFIHLGDPMSDLYFWKQFVAGVFMAIATNGLDQDMMQRNMACRDSRSARKNLIMSGVMQFFVVGLFLILGTGLLLYCERTGIALPEKSDELFSVVATRNAMPAIVGVLFVLGLISAAYSAAGSALTSLTTSFTVDILDGPSRMNDERLDVVRRRVHVAMSILMGIIIAGFYYASNADAISAVYTLASYTYGPILGLFAYGLLCRRSVRPRAIPVVCVAAPMLSWITQWSLHRLFGYSTGFELLLMNAGYTVLLTFIASKQQKSETYVEESV